MTQYWLGLDCGGSWLKAGLYDREGREAGVQRLPLCIKPAAAGQSAIWQNCGNAAWLSFAPCLLILVSAGSK
ncbi:hypothetical protein ECZU26_10650 [Escherichia coli]|nr:hypothetical protein ECZU26_10650 [Escherichia coli]